MPLLNGASAAVNFWVILKLQQRFCIFGLENSQPLSDKIFSGGPKTEIQIRENFSMISSAENDRAKTLSFISLIRRKNTEFENESNV